MILNQKDFYRSRKKQYQKIVVASLLFISDTQIYTYTDYTAEKRHIKTYQQAILAVGFCTQQKSLQHFHRILVVIDGVCSLCQWWSSQWRRWLDDDRATRYTRCLYEALYVGGRKLIPERMFLLYNPRKRLLALVALLMFCCFFFRFIFLLVCKAPVHKRYLNMKSACLMFLCVCM